MGQFLVQEERKGARVQHTQLFPGMGAWGGVTVPGGAGAPCSSPRTSGLQAGLELGLGRGFRGLSLVPASCQSNSNLPGAGAPASLCLPGQGGRRLCQ